MRYNSIDVTQGTLASSVDKAEAGTIKSSVINYRLRKSIRASKIKQAAQEQLPRKISKGERPHLNEQAFDYQCRVAR